MLTSIRPPRYSYAGFPEKGWKLVRARPRTEKARNHPGRSQRSGTESTRSSKDVDASGPNPNVSVPASEQLQHLGKTAAGVSSAESVQSTPPPGSAAPSSSLKERQPQEQRKQSVAETQPSASKLVTGGPQAQQSHQQDPELEAGGERNLEQEEDDYDDNNERDSKEDKDEQNERKERAIQLKNTSMSTLAILLTVISILLAFT